MMPSHPQTARRIAIILAKLKDGPLTVQEVADRACLCYDQAKRYMEFLEGDKQIRVCAWKPRPFGRQHPIPYYTIGNRPSLPKPARMPPRQRQAAYRARIMADDERRDVFLAKARVFDVLQKAKARPQSWLSALGVQ